MRLPYHALIPGTQNPQPQLKGREVRFGSVSEVSGAVSGSWAEPHGRGLWEKRAAQVMAARKQRENGRPKEGDTPFQMTPW